MYRRLVAGKINRALGFMPVAFLEGPRQAGKTTLLRAFCGGDEALGVARDGREWSYHNLDDDETRDQAVAEPAALVRYGGGDGMAIDEIQRAPGLILAIKRAVDTGDGPGKFLLAGSANPDLVPGIPDSLAGRKVTVKVSTLSESELAGTEPTFLAGLLEGRAPGTGQTRIREHLLERVSSGCFPRALAAGDGGDRAAWHEDYVRSLVQRDVRETSSVQRLKELQDLARASVLSTAQVVSYDALARAVKLSPQTVKSYLAHLELWYLLELLPAWHASGLKRLARRPKLHVVDTGLACALMGVAKPALAGDRGLFGRLVETFVYNELRKQATFLGGGSLRFSHFRDNDMHEVDIIVENGMMECFAVEVKSGTKVDKRDFRNMKRFREAAGDRFRMGVILFDGERTLPFGEDMYAAPLASLWT